MLLRLVRPLAVALIGCAAWTSGSALARVPYPRPPKGAVRIGSFYALDPLCVSLGRPSVTLVSAPIGGRVETRETRDYPNFPTSNVRARCDLRKVPVTEVLSGFRGVDTVVFQVVFPRGQLVSYSRRIVVR
jgi:hypothetical protein